MNSVPSRFILLGFLGAATLLASQARAQDLGLSTSIDAGPASLSASVGVSGGDIGVSASVGSGNTAASAEAAASPAGGGLSAGATASSGDVSASGGVSASGSSGKGAGDLSASAASTQDGTGSSAASGRAGAAGSGSAGTAVARSTARPASVRLPEELVPRMTCTNGDSAHCEVDRPSNRDVDQRTPGYRAALAAPGRVVGVPVGTVTACRNGIIRGARPHDPVRIDAVSAGNVRRMQGGGAIAPLMVRIVYDRQGGYEIREAKVNCQLNARGAVVALS